MRDEGLLLREIAERLGLAVSSVHDVLVDPSGEKARARKRKRHGVCVGCGAHTFNSGSVARAMPKRCRSCAEAWAGSPEARLANSAAHRGALVWSDGAIFAALRSVAVGGRVTTNAYAAGYARAPRGAMPSLPLVTGRFGTWSAACRAAGLESAFSYGPRIDRWTVASCWEALAACAFDLGRAPTVRAYEAWASGREDAPSSTTLRARLGNWVEAGLAVAPAVELAVAA